MENMGEYGSVETHFLAYFIHSKILQIEVSIIFHAANRVQKQMWVLHYLIFRFW